MPFTMASDEVQEYNEQMPPSNADSSNDKLNDDNSSTSEEAEPKLKYERVTNDLRKILKKDAISCVTVHSKIFCVGTRWGMVHLLDHQGNSIQNDQVRPHTVAINQLSLDEKAEFLASCSDDGKAYVYGLYTSDHAQEITLSRSIKAVAIDPRYYRLGSHRRFVTGCESLILHERGGILSLGRSLKSMTLHDKVTGSIGNIRWCGRMIAWSCDEGVRIYDIEARCSVVRVKWSDAGDMPCRLCWGDPRTLFIGWANTVRVCVVEKRRSVIKDLSEFVANAVSTICVDFNVVGIAPLRRNQLVILGYVTDNDTGEGMRPQVRIYEIDERGNYSEICREHLSLRGYSNYKCADYHLERIGNENELLIVSPNDVVIGQVYDADDRLEWLLERDKFEEAMLITKEPRKLVRHSKLSVGRKYVDYLIERREFERASKLSAEVLGHDLRLWEEDVYKFAKVGHLRTVCEYLPTEKPYVLKSYIYEMALFEYLKMDERGFLELVRKWPPQIYNVHAVINATLEHIHASKTPFLLEALALLYSYCEQYDNALKLYLQLKSKGVFDLIRKRKLYGAMEKLIDKLMELDCEATIELLVEKSDLSPEIVASKLRNNPYYEYLYLDEFEKTKGKLSDKTYHGRLVQLYANYAPEKLLPLLKRSDNYPIQDALNVCKEKNFYHETVFLLSRIGNGKEALEIIVNQLRDIERAISFCGEQNDPDLWEKLVENSLDKPEFISYLLQRIGTHIDPKILVERIDDNVHIPGLKNSLTKLMRDYSLRVSVEEGCKNIVVSDCFEMHAKLVQVRKKGSLINEEEVCNVCRRKVLIEQDSNIVAFNCGHSYHEKCLPPTTTDYYRRCAICFTQTKGPKSFSLNFI